MKRPVLVSLFGILVAVAIFMIAKQELHTPVAQGDDPPNGTLISETARFDLEQTVPDAAMVDSANLADLDDPGAELDAILALPDSPRRERLLSQALSRWSGQDLVATFRYIASVEDWDLSRPGTQGPENLRVGLTVLYRDTDFHALAALDGEVPPPFDRTWRSAVVQGLARQDPVAATEFYETLPAAEQREVGFAVATEYAKADFRAAFEWAQSLDEPRYVANVMRTVGEQDPLLALDLALQTEEPDYLKDVAQAAIQGGAIAPESFGAALLGLPASEGKEQALEAMTHYWAVRDPDRDPVHVLEWLIAAGESTADSPQLFRNIAGRITDLDVADSYTDEIPPAARSVWIQTIADGTASRDPVGAAAWIEQFRGEPAYGPSLSVIAIHLASQDGAGAADLLRRAALETDANTVSRIARRWASRDPRAATDWLQTLDDDGARVAGLGGAALVWMGKNPEEAEPWVLGLPSGKERDVILYSMISASFITETEPSDALFRAYSSDYALQVAAVNAAREFERRNETLARRVLDRYVTHSQLRSLFASESELPPPP